MRELPVMISGAGPVGLTTLILLSRFGMPTLLVERRASVSTLPRARGFMSRPVEIWSRLLLAWIKAALTSAGIASWFAHLTGGGGTGSKRFDLMGKALGQQLLDFRCRSREIATRLRSSTTPAPPA